MAKIITIPYKPHEKQLLVHNDEHRFKVIVCGRRWGKTILAVNELIKKAMMTPGQYWYVAPTYKQAHLIAWEMLKRFAVPELRRKKPDETELKVDLINGASIRLMGADNPDSLRGVGLRGVVLDEFADIKRSVWTTIIRPMLSDYKGWAIFLGTPKGKINHLYEHFIKDTEHHDADYRTPENISIDADKDYKSFIFRTVDNPYIDPIEIEKAKQELAPQYFKQEYEASFENYTGLIYKEFNDAKHIISINATEKETGRKFIKDWWKVYIGIDTGRHTAVSFMTIDDKGKKYIFDEIYSYDDTVFNVASQIKHKLAQWGIAKTPICFIDSASQVKREYEANKIYCVDSEKDVENQIEQVRKNLAHDTICYNSDKCPMHIVEHKGYIWDEKAKKPQPIKENDHTVNAVQYILSTYMAVKSKDTEKENKFKQSVQYYVQYVNKTKEQNKIMS